MYAFDKACGVAAVEEACRLGLPATARSSHKSQCPTPIYDVLSLHPGDLLAAANARLSDSGG